MGLWFRDQPSAQVPGKSIPLIGKVGSSTRALGLRAGQQKPLVLIRETSVFTGARRRNKMATAEIKNELNKCPRATRREPGFLKWSHGYGRTGTMGCRCPPSSAFGTSLTECFNGFELAGTSGRRLLPAVDVG